MVVVFVDFKPYGETREEERWTGRRSQFTVTKLGAIKSNEMFPKGVFVSISITQSIFRLLNIVRKGSLYKVLLIVLIVFLVLSNHYYIVGLRKLTINFSIYR